MLDLRSDEAHRLRKALIKDPVAEKALAFSLLSDPSRYRVLKALALHPELCVSDLTELLNMTMPAVSHHLRLLKDADVVECWRDGQMICYRLAKTPIAAFVRRALARSLEPA
ncbi:MAG: winged helix-turn-helix transcriptional regulator [Candidatus Kerfeldbacteria bacterium]|nr:winged helix-turn-helix transcriptional regulator [Candidatus Kerfeldbacteria bacterium]